MRRVVVAFVVIVAMLAGAIVWTLRPARVTFLTDSDTIREPAEAAAVREVLWQRPGPLADLVNAGGDEFEPRVSPDGGSLYFVKGKPGRNSDIVVCTRQRAGWSSPVPFGEVNTEHDELGPEPSADGLAVYFYSDRPGGLGGYDLWVIRKVENEWEPPTNVGAPVNSPYNEYGPALSPDGRTLCFSSNRPKTGENPPSDDAWRATVREDLYSHDYDLYVAPIIDAGPQRATSIDRLNSPWNEGAPAFSPVGDFLYFSSDRPGGLGGFDLYRARVVLGGFQMAANLGGAVNTAANELDPALDVGGYALHFSSDRPAADGATPGKAHGDTPSTVPRYHLYRTFSREVFPDVEVRQTVIEWSALWSQIGPNMMWALLSLMVFLLLIALLRDLSRRRLGLLTRCMIVSLMIHMLLMLWFNAVKVTTSIAAAIQRSGPIQVSLAGVARDGGLSAQIRGGLVGTGAPAATLPQLDRVATPVTAVARVTAVEVPIEAVSATPPASTSLHGAVVEAVLPRIGMPHRFRADLTPPGAGSGHYSLPETLARTATNEGTESAPPAIDLPLTRRGVIQSSTTHSALHQVRVELAVGKSQAPQARPDRVIAGGLPVDTVPVNEQPGSTIATLAPTSWTAALAIDPALPFARTALSLAVEEESPTAAVIVPAPPRAAASFMLNPAARPGEIHSFQPDAVSAPITQPSLFATRATGSLDVMPGFDEAAPRDPPLAIPVAFKASPGVGVGESQLALPPTGIIGNPSNAEATGPISPSEVLGVQRLPTPPGVPFPSTPTPSGTVDLAPRPSTPLVAGAEQRLVGDSPHGGGGSDAGGLRESGVVNQAFDTPRLPILSTPGLTADPAQLDVGLPDGFTPSPPSATAIPPEQAVGRIHGRVTDALSRVRMADARIQLDLPGGSSIIAITGPTGAYEIAVPDLPDYFAISASKPGYLPRSRNVANRSVVGRSMRLNFALKPETPGTIAVEDTPVVHHLGNDRYEGRINSQFQREAEGRTYLGSFDLSAGQVPSREAELTLLAKGVQCPHKIRINGHLLDARLDHSPPDGGFGTFTARFDASLLQEGENTIEIRAVSCTGDLDDFEFVNLNIRLHPQEH